MKIPIVGEKAYERFQNEATGVSALSLGLAIKIVKEEITKICEITKKQKKLKRFSKKCCKKIEPTTDYGRNITSHRKKKKKFKNYKKKWMK